MTAVDSTPPAEGSRARRDHPGPRDPRRRVRRRVTRRHLSPYLLVLPTLVVLLAVLGYPLVRLLWLSLHDYSLPQLLGQPADFVGVAHFTDLVTDSFFWTVLVRTLVFTVANVGLTMFFGMVIALLMRRVHPAVRGTLSATLVLVWSMPWLVAVAVFQWMVDYQFGVLNYALTKLPFVDLTHHNWFVHPWQGFAVITAVVVWGAIPFVAIALHAALTQVPRDIEEAGSIDGAGRWQLFWNVTLPVIKPVVLILTTYSVIWDFQVFNQIYVMLGGRPTPDYYLFSIWSYQASFGSSNYGLGSAVAVVMVVILLGATFGYVRQMLRVGEVE